MAREASKKLLRWRSLGLQALGDRSENADYTFNKRVYFVRLIAECVSYANSLMSLSWIYSYNKGKVFFGAWVEIENDDDGKLKFRIVGPEEIYGDAKGGYISIDSPMARALLKKKWMMNLR